MPSFAQRYSEKQRAALYRACIDEQEPVKTFLRTCREEGCDGLDRREARELGSMAYAYATRLVADERLKRQALVMSAAEPEPAIRELIVKQLVMAQEECEKLYRHPASKLRDHGALVVLAKLTKELQGLSAQTRGPSKNAQGEDTDKDEQPMSFAARMLAQAQEDSDSEDPSEDASQTPRNTENHGV